MRYTPSERQAHLDLWRESGLSKAAYCRQSGLPYHSLISWSRQPGSTIDGDSVSSDDEGFIELERPSTPVGSSLGATVDLGAGRRLTIASSTDPEWAGRLLGAIFRC